MCSTVFYNMGVKGFHILDGVLCSPMDEILLFLLAVSSSVGIVVHVFVHHPYDVAIPMGYSHS